MQAVENIQKAFLRLCALAMVGTTLLMLFLTDFQMVNYEKRCAAANKYLAAFSAFADLTPKVMPFQNLNSKIWKDKVPAESLLKAIGGFIPNGVVLDEVVLDQGAQSLILRGGVLVSKEVSAMDVLSGMVYKMKSAPYFSRVELISSAEGKKGKVFEIKCRLGF
jgi:hypothetical protein